MNRSRTPDFAPPFETPGATSGKLSSSSSSIEFAAFRSRLRQAIKVADSITNNSTILNQTCLSRYQGVCALDDIVAAILESPLIEIKTRE